MSVECAYAGCKNRRKERDNVLTFFKFPVRKPNILFQWLQNSGNTDLLGVDESILIHKRLCENHFSKDDVYPSGERKLLRRNVVPIPWEDMSWTNEMILEFLDLYQNEPVIWDANTPGHKNRNDVYDAWKRIELNMDEKFSVTELKKKRESLMASFRTCLNKVKQSAGTGNEYKPQWFAYDKLASFLFKKNPEQTRNIEEILLDEGYSNFEIEDESDTISVKAEYVHFEDDLRSEVAQPVAQPSPLENEFMPQSSSRKRPRLSKPDGIKSETNNIQSIKPQYATNSVHDHSKVKKMCALYGELIAAKLELMDERSRDICMNKIDNVMFKTKMRSSRKSSNKKRSSDSQSSNSSLSPSISD
ncbi:uncharacterized protein LOC115883689 [Sitophilus oryzae]|uniref:Uncharacterized protein LOC115883689 n=1 Tax=Sitophilus oryzae TaxID=7048 RepID=A0A6J2Y2K7_SITOR|nr:uncharacterized protein LOC115883689 [Sitophilus oryzae]